MRPAQMAVDGDQVFFKFGYNKTLLKEIKSLDTARWDPDRKIWRAKATEHTAFALRYLFGGNPYYQWEGDPPDIDIPEHLPLYKHQREMVCAAYARRQIIFAAEQGTGKTLVWITLMLIDERENGPSDWLYVGPKSALTSVQLELRKWGYTRPVRMVTYSSLKKTLENWDGPTPNVFFDEAHALKNPASQRSKAAAYLAEQIRKRKGYIILATGTPAPKAPTDWWHLCHVAQPGYLKEPNIHKLRDRLAILEEQTNAITGGVYKKILGWKDDTDRCLVCGLLRSDHGPLGVTNRCSGFQPGVNEVALLHKRMQGLVQVYRSKDCLDLPERIFETVTCTPSPALLNAAKIIAKTATNAAGMLTLLRQLSDGFQYRQIKKAEKAKCDLCEGSGLFRRPIPLSEDATDPSLEPDLFEWRDSECPNCFGDGEVDMFERTVEEVNSPKDDVLRDQLSLCEEDGRIIIWAAYQGSIDRCERLARKAGWDTIKIDGRGYISTLSDDRLEMLETFQDKSVDKKIAVIANPHAGGTGLTLTASRVAVYFSNSFSFEAREQSLFRNWRIGQDRGVKIIDICNLPTDQYVLDNLQKKRTLQSITLGEVLNEVEKFE